MHLSISSYLWLEHPFLQHVRTVAQAGFDSLEIFATRGHLDLNDPDAVQEAGLGLRKYSVRRVTLHAPMIGVDLSSPNAAQRGESLELCLRALDAGALLGASLVTVHPSSVEGEARDAPRRWPALLASLRELARYAADRDLAIGVENHPRPLFADDPIELAARIEGLCLRNVGISLDLGHAYVNGQIPGCIRYLAGSLMAVQASDTSGRADEHLCPGRGTMPWEKVFVALAEAGFAGPIVIEIKDERPLGVVLEDVNRFAEHTGLLGVGHFSS
jgi:sugar phosphate isomerase/epimerase